MSNKVLGRCACPLCGCPDQEVKETAKNNPKPYLCCEDCQVQIFARGAKSSRILKSLSGRIIEHLRELIDKILAGSGIAKTKPEPAAPVEPKPEPVKPPAVEPVAPAVADKKTEPAEKTIFDWLS